MRKRKDHETKLHIEEKNEKRARVESSYYWDDQLYTLLLKMRKRKDETKLHIEEKNERVESSYIIPPLHYALYCKDSQMFMNHLKNGANIEELDPLGRTPLQHALDDEFDNLALVLIDRGANFKVLYGMMKKEIHCVCNEDVSYIYHLLSVAIQQNQLHIVNVILKDRIDEIYEAHIFTLLDLAIIEGNIDIVSLLIEKGADIEMAAYQYTPLEYAIIEGQINIVSFLIEKGANIKTTSLFLAVKKGFIDIVSLLVEKGANMEAYILLQTPLHMAIKKKSLDIVSLLVEKGANIEAYYLSKTPLHMAIEKNSVDIVSFLIKKGANIEALRHDKTPLQIALKMKHFMIASILIHSGATIGKTIIPYDVTEMVDWLHIERDILLPFDRMVNSSYSSSNTIIDVNAIMDGDSVFMDNILPYIYQ